MRRPTTPSDRETRPSNGSGRSADPFAPENKDKGSLIWNTARFLRNLFSHRGAFWLGAAIALVSFIANTFFYFGLLTLGGLTGWQAAIGGAGISFATALFRLMPVILTHSREMTLSQIFSAGAKPKELPELSDKVVGDAEELMRNYRNSDRSTRNFFKTMRWIAIGAESFLGVLFLGGVGVGGRALLKLITFVISSNGLEWGVILALRAAEWELPPAIRRQLDELINNAGQALNLKRVD